MGPCRNRFSIFLLFFACIGTSLAQSLDIPDWEIAAGGKLAFDVASVKPTDIPKLPSFPLDNGNTKTPGGRFSASFGLAIYIGFAYKLNPSQARALPAQLPKWANMERFEVDALAPGNPSKDQMRLMMQSLFADRFKLAVHFEARETPVLALTLAEPGKIGPKLRAHSEGPPCPDSYTPPGLAAPPKTGEVFPLECGTAPSWFRADGTALVGSRNSTMQSLSETVEVYGFLSGDRGGPNRPLRNLRLHHRVEWASARAAGVGRCGDHPTGTGRHVISPGSKGTIRTQTDSLRSSRSDHRNRSRRETF